jgi:hypothetical protein
MTETQSAGPPELPTLPMDSVETLQEFTSEITQKEG